MKILLLLFLVRHSWAATNCDAPGSFRQARDPTCKNYFTCRLLLNTYYIKDSYTCGTLMRFNPTTQQCDYGSVCIDSLCDNRLPLEKLPDPNALNSTCRQTVVQCEGIMNQYPTIAICDSPTGCC